MKAGPARRPSNFCSRLQRPRAVFTCLWCTLAGSDFVNTSATLSSVPILRTSMLPCATYSRTFRSRRSTCLER
eukprot:6180768-Pleurochrysis_carterae.AAC.1